MRGSPVVSARLRAWLLLVGTAGLAACSPGFTASTPKDSKSPPTGTDTSDSASDTADADTDADTDSDTDADTDADADTDTDTDPITSCDQVAPGPGSVATDPTCEFTPSRAGTQMLPTVEWAMTQRMDDPATGATIPAYVFADSPDWGSVYQAPFVLQITDDNGDGAVDDLDVPEIGVVMAHYDHAVTGGVLRVISGDGSRVHASLGWATHSDGERYAPWHFSGVAAADLDADGEVEIAAHVVRESDGTCYPAYYEAERTAGGGVRLSLTHVYGGAAYNCGGHSPAIADLTGDGTLETIYGRAVFRGTDLTQVWYGAGGRGWYGRDDYPAPEGYWNSGYHAFAYDVDGDGRQMEVVAGRTIYTSTGGTWCELGEYAGGVWTPAIDGYPAIADLKRFPGDMAGEPEVVLTGNEYVSVYHAVPDYDPNGLARCTLVARLPNDPAADPAVSGRMPAHPSCEADAASFGGPATISDFDADGDAEVAVAGGCWYSVFRFDGNTFERFAMAQTQDWSSASTGSTVFDFNDDGANEIVFSDEEAVYVWQVDTGAGLDPWERLVEVLRDDQHESWTIHEYPLVADVDGDGKAEIVVSNSFLPEDQDNITYAQDRYGLYVLGALDDDWVTSRNLWNQHAYHITNVEDDGTVDYATPNYAPYTPEHYNSFRTQAPGTFGALAASDLIVSLDACQLDCGPLTIWMSVGNQGEFVYGSAGTPLGLYGEAADGTRTLLANAQVRNRVAPGEVQAPLEVRLDGSVWSVYERIVAVVDDPDLAGAAGGRNQECDEGNNEAALETSAYCN